MSRSATVAPHLFKYIIIGDTEVGKSSLMLMFTEQHFNPSHDMTIGVEFDSRSITLADGSTAKLEIWDTAGQESYLSITRSYYRGTDCCLLVYDVTRRESYDRLGHWLKEAKQNSSNPNLVLVVVANKADLTEKRLVSSVEGKAFAESQGALFVELSARDQKKVDNIFSQSAQRILAVQRLNPVAKAGAVVRLDQTQKQSNESVDCVGSSCG